MSFASFGYSLPRCAPTTLPPQTDSYTEDIYSMPTIAYDRDAMSNRSSQEPEVASARSDFARRLRELRILRGFRTARSLARTLEIDENRYTRYERAEVEPDLDMIRRICSTLSVSPSELLGHDGGPGNSRSTATGRRGGGQRGRPDQRATSETNGAFGLPAAAWALAEDIIRSQKQTATGELGAAPSPLADVSEIGALYRSIMRQPFEAITAMLQNPSVADAPPEIAATLRRRIDDLVRHVKATPAGG